MLFVKGFIAELEQGNVLFYNIYEHTLDAHYKFTWYRFVDGKPSLYMGQLYAFNLPSECKQAITASRHEKASFGS